MGERALDMFEAITAVNNGLVPRDALPTGAIEPVIEIQQAEPSKAVAAVVEPAAPDGDDLLVAVDPSLAAELAATVNAGADAAATAASGVVHSDMASETAGSIETAVAAYSASAGDATPADAGAVVQPVAVESELSTRMTERMPELSDAPPIASRFAERAPIAALPLRAAVTDKIARERGLPPISEPYVRERERVRVARGWFYAALVIAIASLVVCASVVMWARGEVRRARDVQPPSRPLAAASMAIEAPQPPPTPAIAAAPEPPSCSVRVTSTVDHAAVWIAGERVGDVPAEIPVTCGHETTVEVRRARYQSFKSAVVVPDGTVVIDARLERKRRRH